MNRKTIIVGFDMETDIGSWTLNDQGIKKGTVEILKVLRIHDIPATFLFTGREAQNNPRMVKTILDKGHEIGCHTMYHETMGTAVFDMPGANFVLESEIKGRLELATKTVAGAAGVRPVSFRAPRLFGSTAMINALEELGYRVDSSFPCYFYHRDFTPYHPSRRDWSKNGKSTILELPVFFDMDAGQDDPTHRNRDQWPMLRLKGAKWFGNLCQRMFANVHNARGDSVLCLYLHPWEFIEMPKSVITDEAKISFQPFLYKNCGDSCLASLDEFICHMKHSNVQFTTMKDYATN
ncbi:MAG: polysaccharide deacetylase family protein [Phycisphaerae bacterium]